MGDDRGYRCAQWDICGLIGPSLSQRALPVGARLCCGARPPNRAAARAAPLRARLRSVPYRRRGARHRFGPLCGPRSPARAPRCGKSDACQSGAAPRPCLRLSQASGVCVSRLEDGQPGGKGGGPLRLRVLVSRLPSPRASRRPPARGATCNQRGHESGETYNSPVM